MDFRKATEATKDVAKLIETPSGKDWDTKTHFIHMVEEMGELANTLLVEYKDKSEKRRRTELADSLCDILFDLLLIADVYGIDLDKEYPKVLEHIRKRAESGGFVD